MGGDALLLCLGGAALGLVLLFIFSPFEGGAFIPPPFCVVVVSPLPFCVVVQFFRVERVRKLNLTSGTGQVIWWSPLLLLGVAAFRFSPFGCCCFHLLLLLLCCFSSSSSSSLWVVVLFPSLLF